MPFGLERAGMVLYRSQRSLPYGRAFIRMNMTRHTVAHTTGRTLALWTVGVLVVVCFTLLGAAEAAAEVDTSCDNDATEPKSASEQQPEADAFTPCELSRHDSPSYNVCFAANPLPVTTMPKWMARYKAGRLAGEVFGDVQTLYSDALHNSQQPPRFSATTPEWIEVLSEQLHDLRSDPMPEGACFEGDYDEQCNFLPSPAVLVTSGSFPPVHVHDDELEVPPRPLIEERSQPPLVQLRVGPAVGHDSPPDRPPPA